MTTTLEILIAARELLSDAKRWTQGALAKSAKGNPVNPRGRYAVCWCMVGALVHFNPDIFRDDPFLERGPFRFLEIAIDDGLIPVWQDDGERTHAEVLVAFDRAIELTRAEEVRHA